MKKSIFAIALAISLFSAIEPSAQVGIIGGLTSSTTQVKNIDSKSLNLYHVGLITKVDLGMGFAIQPGLIYQVKGVALGEISENTKTEDFQLKSGFLEIPVGLQWGPDLLAFRPYLFAEPFVGYQISGSDSAVLSGSNEDLKNWASEAKNKLEYGFGLGLGIEFGGRLQLSAQYFNNMGKLFNEDKVDTAVIKEDVKESLKDGNFKGFKLSLAILF